MNSEYAFRGDILQQLIEKSNLPIKAVAEKMGISTQSLHNYIEEYKMPSYVNLLKIASYFAVPIDVLAGRCSNEEYAEIIANYDKTFRALRRDSYEAYLIKKSSEESHRNFPDISNLHTFATWPNNLVDKIFGEQLEILLTDDQLAGLEKAIAELSLREQKCIYSYYRDEMTLDEIGQAFGVMRERIRQIIAKALRKLRHPSRSQFIKYGLQGGTYQRQINNLKTDLDHKKKILEEESELVDKQMKELHKKGEESGVTVVNSFDDPLMDSIDNLGLSVRLYNCLARANCRTVRDVIDLAKSRKLFRIRNLGKRSLAEILTKLSQEYGVDLFDIYRKYL